MKTPLTAWRVIAWAFCAATAMLIGFGYVATAESKRAAQLLLERRVNEQLALLMAAITQDMRAAHATVLVPVTPGQLVPIPPYELIDAFAHGFARFPYPESFFAWKESDDGVGVTYVFNRADRPPAWHRREPFGEVYPVETVRDPAALRPLVAEIAQLARYRRPFGVIETRIGETPYQVIAHFLYRPEDPGRLFGLVGFVVNLDWVREQYFAELTSQVARIGGNEGTISVAVAYGEDVLATTATGALQSPAAARSFPLVFFDRALLRGLPPSNAPFRTLTARAGAAADPTLAAAALGGDSLFVLISLSAVAAVVGLLLAARNVRLAAELAAMKSEFVSNVTHELKTPLAVIRLIGDTLAHRRHELPEPLREYGMLLSRENANLTRLIDNLLAYARLSDVRRAYAFEPTNVSDLVDYVLERFESLLLEQQFSVEVDVPSDLPLVHADRSALIGALENLIDNAMKYSNDTRVLQVQARSADRRVTITVKDLGRGIPPEELPRIGEKFFRGSGATSRGSGLGLAMVRRVVEDHGGRLAIDSEPGRGTAVHVVLPSSRA